MNNKFKILVIIAINFFLASCQTSTDDLDEFANWQQPYPLVCAIHLPIEPVCLDSPFDYQSDYDSCRVDMQNYEEALRFQASCVERELKMYLEAIYPALENLLLCEEEEYLKYNEGIEGIGCSVSLPKQSDILLSLGDHSLGISSRIELSPFLITSYCGKPTNSTNVSSKIVSCMNSIRDFLEVDINTRYQNILSKFYGKGLYGSGIRGLLDNAVDKFNCRASGSTYCF